MTIQTLSLLVVLFPLIAGVCIGLLNKRLSENLTYGLSVGAILLSFLSSLGMVWGIHQGESMVNIPLYTWGEINGVRFELGFYIDHLTTLMISVVSFVSLMVHIYTIGYMKEDPGYRRFFSYILLFTFGMLMLVMANNFLQLFFGWEMVGLMSYLLIGFWFTKESALQASLKAFLMNRIGDFGFIIGIAAVFNYFGTLDYAQVFGQAESFAVAEHSIVLMKHLEVSALSFICLSLFVGAIGKSAQMPLHVWLPDSMEGPTPISALIHAATMVTAGVFMVARLSPLFEYSETALNTVLTVGAITAFFTGLLAIVQSDIKRIIAYSTLSQLGIMMTAMGVSAYGLGIFHLMTHAFFKALLFLGAGSCILALHHEQNIWKMGNLRRVLPVTYITMIIGGLALMGFPYFSGFYSKDLIIEAVKLSALPAAPLAYISLVIGVFITALYTFRLLFVVFHGSFREKNHGQLPTLHEPGWVVLGPLVLLALASLSAGAIFLDTLYQDYFLEAFRILPSHDKMAELKAEFGSWWQAPLNALLAPSVWFGLVGLGTAWLCYIKMPMLPGKVEKRFYLIYQILNKKYGFDILYQHYIMPWVKTLAWFCFRVSDQALIDGIGVNGTANSVGRMAMVLRRLQTGYLYHYAFVMILGFVVFMIWFKLKD